MKGTEIMEGLEQKLEDEGAWAPYPYITGFCHISAPCWSCNTKYE